MYFVHYTGHSTGQAMRQVGPPAGRSGRLPNAHVSRRAPKGRTMPDETIDPATSASLLIRLQQAPADQDAWLEFLRRYGPRIHNWCRRWGLQEADAQDVTQNVLLKLTRAMQAFRY